MPTNVPAPTLGPVGFQPVAESALLRGVFADFNDAFDGNLNTDLTTPQGQLAMAIAAVLGANQDFFLQYVNQVDPQYSDGRMQDAIARIYYLTRQPAESTTVDCVCVGRVNTLIPRGALAKGTDGTLYACTTGGRIDTSGTITLPFAAVTPGPISAPAHTVTTIYRVVPGWDSIDNPVDGIPGQDEESRVALEARRSASVAANAVGVLDAVRGAVLAVPGVLDAMVLENPTAASATVRGVTINARSLYVSVAGGDLDEVALAIWRKKPPGCGYTGSTTRTVYDPAYPRNPPSYSVSFTVPTVAPIRWSVSITNGPGVPSDALEQVRAAVRAAFIGADGGQRAGIGGTIYASRYYAGIAALGAWASGGLLSVEVGTTYPADAQSVTLTAAQIPTFVPGNVYVTLV